MNGLDVLCTAVRHAKMSFDMTALQLGVEACGLPNEMAVKYSVAYGLSGERLDAYLAKSGISRGSLDAVIKAMPEVKNLRIYETPEFVEVFATVGRKTRMLRKSKTGKPLEPRTDADAKQTQARYADVRETFNPETRTYKDMGPVAAE